MARTGRNSKNGWQLLMLIIIFGLAGSAIGQLLGESVTSLDFLSDNMVIGLTSPIILDLKLVSITLGISFNVNIVSILGMIIGFIFYKKI